MVSLERRLRGPLPVNREAEKNVDSPDSIDLQPHHLPVQDRAKHEVQGREGKVPMVNLAASPEVRRLLQLSARQRNRSAERKMARGLRRHEGHNSFFLIILAALEQKPGPLFLCVSCGRLCQTPGKSTINKSRAFHRMEPAGAE